MWLFYKSLNSVFIQLYDGAFPFPQLQQEGYEAWMAHLSKLAKGQTHHLRKNLIVLNCQRTRKVKNELDLYCKKCSYTQPLWFLVCFPSWQSPSKLGFTLKGKNLLQEQILSFESKFLIYSKKKKTAWVNPCLFSKNLLHEQILSFGVNPSVYSQKKKFAWVNQVSLLSKKLLKEHSFLRQ